MTETLDAPTQGWSPTGPLAGRYELGGLLGSGGAAEVFRGTDLRLGRPVAVKVFREGAGPGMTDRLEDEALLLARLEHAGLVTVYDMGRHEGRSYLVMQLVEGRTLRQCAAGVAMDPHHVARLGAGLADTLAHVHAADVMHCDVKPSNILLDAEGRPYLTDFGISRPVGTASPAEDGALVGTAAYLAPEQVRGERVEQPADIYALGLVLLECLKGELEYPGTPLESAVARLHRQPAVPSWLPAELADLLREMTSPEPRERPDARSCAERLEHVRATVRPGLFPSPAGEFAEDGTGVGPALLRTGAGSGDTRHDLPSVPVQGGRRRTGVLAAAGAAVVVTVMGVTLGATLSATSAAGGTESVTVLDNASDRSTGRSASPTAPRTAEAAPSVKGSEGARSAKARKPDTPSARGLERPGPRPAAVEGAQKNMTGKKPGRADKAGKPGADAKAGKGAGPGPDGKAAPAAQRGGAGGGGAGRGRA